MEIKEFLSKIEKLDLIIANKFTEIEQWRNIAEGLSSAGKTVNINGVLHNMDKVQTTRTPDKMENAILRIIEITEEIESDIENLKSAKREIASLIERLKPMDYDFLHKVYVQQLTLYDVAALYGKSYSWATTIHGRALKNAQRLLDEEKELRKNLKKSYLE